MKKNLLLAVLLPATALFFAASETFAQPPGFGGDRGSSTRGTDRSSSSSRSSQNTSSSVVAVADERSNSVVVSAPAELLPMVEELIREIDSIIQRTAAVRVFPLRFSDAEEMASLVVDMFDDRNTGSSRFGGTTTRGSSMAIRTTAEHDVRTNSVVVSADQDKMPLIAEMIQTLDQDPARDQKVFIYDLKNANPESVSLILQDIVNQNQGRGTSGGGGTNRSSTSPFTQRPVTGGTGGTGGFGGTTFGGGTTTRR